jgi:hypothetical protein
MYVVFQQAYIDCALFYEISSFEALQYLSYYMHKNIKNAQYILENKMLTSIVTHYKSLELSILNIKSALYQYRP